MSSNKVAVLMVILVLVIFFSLLYLTGISKDLYISQEATVDGVISSNSAKVTITTTVCYETVLGARSKKYYEHTIHIDSTLDYIAFRKRIEYEKAVDVKRELHDAIFLMEYYDE